MNVRPKVKRRMRPPVGDATATVTHKYLQQGPFYSRAAEPGAGDVDAGTSRSRSSRPDELGVVEPSKRDPTSGSIGAVLRQPGLPPARGGHPQRRSQDRG